MSDVRNLINETYERVRSLLPARSGNPKIKTSTLNQLEDLEIEINQFLLPTIESILVNKDEKLMKRVETGPAFKIMTGKLFLNVKSFNTLLEDIKHYFEDVNHNMVSIENLVKANLNDLINDRTMTYQQLGIVEMVSMLSNNAEYSKRLIYYLIMDADRSVLSKNFSLDIQTQAGVFREHVLNKANNVKTTIDGISKLSTDVVYDGAMDDNVPDAVRFDNLDITTISNFIGNPIYKIRMWLVDRDLKRRDLSKELAQLTSIRLTELRAELDGSEKDENVLKMIEYYEDKLNKYNARIAKLEKVD